MHPPDDRSWQAAQLLTMRIIVLAMVTGAALFAGIAAFLQQQQANQEPATGGVLSLVALAVAVANFVLHRILPGAVASRQRRSIAWSEAPLIRGQSPPLTAQAFDPTRTLWAIYQTTLLIALALLEGSAFLLLVAYLIEGTVLCLVAGLLVAGGMACYFPTKEGINRWVETQRELIQDDRLNRGE